MNKLNYGSPIHIFFLNFNKWKFQHNKSTLCWKIPNISGSTCWSDDITLQMIRFNICCSDISLQMFCALLCVTLAKLLPYHSTVVTKPDVKMQHEHSVVSSEAIIAILLSFQWKSHVVLSCCSYMSPTQFWIS